jgi:hypothetical protein
MGTWEKPPGGVKLIELSHLKVRGNHTFPQKWREKDKKSFFFFVLRQPYVSLGFLIVEVSRSFSDTAHSIGFL